LFIAASRLGIAYVYAGRLAEGLPLLEQGVQQETSHHPEYGLHLVFLGEGYWRAGRFAEALSLAHQALKLSCLRRERGNEAYALHFLGVLATHGPSPEWAQAASWYQQALALAEARGMRPLLAHCYLGLGRLYCQTHCLEQAHTVLSAAVTLYRAMEMTHWLHQAEAVLAQEKAPFVPLFRP
jgi:tetratricopeptide (TPR) repeat protein